MNRQIAARLARELMDRHGLNEWKIEWSRAKRTHGQCVYAKKTLIFSAVAFDHIGESEARDTILHEIAHALVGPSAAAHGYVWKGKCLEIGGTGKQYVSREASDAIPAAWIGTCRNGHITKQHRAPLRVKACGRCSSRFDPNNIYTWKHNNRPVCLREMPNRYAKEAIAIHNRYGVKF